MQGGLIFVFQIVVLVNLPDGRLFPRSQLLRSQSSATYKLHPLSVPSLSVSNGRDMVSTIHDRRRDHSR